MLPFKRNKIDISVSYRWLMPPSMATYSSWLTQKLSEEEQKLFRLYGKLPAHKNILTKMQGVSCMSCHSPLFLLYALQERKYFDSGDYALSKAGVAPQNTVGTAIPNPDK